MNSDFRISVGFSRHHKTRKLKRLLGADGVLSLIWLWEYTAAERPDGNLSKLDDDDIELAADWNGEAGAFVKAIKAVGFLDDGNILHDWQEHNSWASNFDARSDKARLSKLAQVNAIEYQRLVDEGITGISKEQYEKLAKAGEKLRTAGDSLATAGETLANGKQTEGDSLAPAPAPSPALTHKEKTPLMSPQGGKPAPVRVRFTPPTLGEIEAYCIERGNLVNPEKFFNHYESVGWMCGKAKMKDWKAAVRKWEPDAKPTTHTYTDAELLGVN